MAKLYIILCFCLIQVYGRASAPTDDHIEELNKEVQNTVKTLVDEFHQVTGIEKTHDVENFHKTLHSNLDDLAEKMTGVIKTFNAEAKAHSGEVETAIKSLKEKVTEAVKKVKDDHPEETKKVEEFSKNVEHLYSDISKRITTAVEAINKDTTGVRADLNKFAESMLTEFKKNAEHFNKDLKKVIDDHQKGH